MKIKLMSTKNTSAKGLIGGMSNSVGTMNCQAVYIRVPPVTANIIAA
ncbi:MAG: hypothetical protein O2962_03130 [Cyanobacteria bacterium]|nr:hypothetical protein [Cyanobacteriota bacterium]